MFLLYSDVALAERKRQIVMLTNRLAAGAELGAKGSDAVASLTYSAVQHGNMGLLEALLAKGVLEVWSLREYR